MRWRCLYNDRDLTVSSQIRVSYIYQHSRWEKAHADHNLVNGTYACENDAAVNGILRGELGFQGCEAPSFYFALGFLMLMSLSQMSCPVRLYVGYRQTLRTADTLIDWYATHSTVAAANGGLDVSSPTRHIE